MDSNLRAKFLQENGMDKTIYTREYSVLLRLLAERREKSALTQTQLAKKLGVTQSTISKFERGDRRLDVIQLRTICSHLGVSLSDFVAELEQRIPKRRSRGR